MSVHEETLLWKYIDGDCTPEERQRVEALVRADEQMARSFQLMQQMHQRLSRQEADQPSLRFSKNVLEQLPQLYAAPTVQPLLNPLWIYVTTALLVISALATAWWQAPAGSAATPLFPSFDLVPFAVGFQEWINNVLASGLWIAPLFGLSLLLLFDRLLQKVISPKS